MRLEGNLGEKALARFPLDIYSTAYRKGGNTNYECGGSKTRNT